MEHLVETSPGLSVRLVCASLGVEVGANRACPSAGGSGHVGHNLV